MSLLQQAQKVISVGCQIGRFRSILFVSFVLGPLVVVIIIYYD